MKTRTKKQSISTSKFNREDFEKKLSHLLCQFMATRGFSMKCIQERTGLSFNKARSLIYGNGLTLGKYRNGETLESVQMIDHAEISIKREILTNKRSLSSFAQLRAVKRIAA